MSSEISIIRTFVTDNGDTWYSILCDSNAEQWVRSQDRNCWGNSHVLTNLLDVNSELMSFIKLKCSTE
jgi:hypothetical protein